MLASMSNVPERIGMRKLSSRFIGKASATVTKADINRFINRVVDEKSIKMIMVLVKKARLPSSDLSRNL